MIESADNTKIKLAKKLLSNKKERDKEGLFAVEGPHLIEEAVKSGIEIKYILYGSKAETALAALNADKIEKFMVSDKIIASVSDTVTSQGILAVVKKPKAGPGISGKYIVMCDSIQDPGNLGTIIRSAAASGFNVVVSGDSADVYNPKTVRATQGALFKTAVFEDADLKEALKKTKGRVLGAKMNASKSIYEVKLDTPFTVIIGNEAGGIRKELLDLCDEKVKIPMEAGVESLNAGVCASIIMFESMRQRGQQNAVRSKQ
ncbi:MAG: RNA methyltransferase [Candidatus Saganbacteria bacterium]|nr:RNA methyltransferase [Candidatus Saganbacteria bacterium]